MGLGKPIPKKVLNNFLDNTPKICARYKEGGCSEHLTIEHPWARSGEMSHNLIYLCEKHHGLGAYWDKKHFNKEINKYHAYKNIPDEELSKMKLGNQYLQEKKYLMNKYG